MPKVKKFFTCSQCDYQSQQWLGKCPQCGGWNTFVEGQTQEIKPKNKATAGGLLESFSENLQPINLDKVKPIESKRIKTGIAELDRVFGGGIVPGGVILIGGEPGIGKSTIMLQMAMQLAQAYDVIYVSGEENPEQIKLRADRINIPTKYLKIYPQPDIDQAISTIRTTDSSPESLGQVVIVDSIQTVFSADVDAAAGSVNQVKESTARLVRFAKASSTPVLIIGHVTKEGTIAGPKVLEHLVDTVIYLEGERYHDLRIMRAVKNRFGAASELGVFEMSDKGLREVENPSKVFLEGRTHAPGAVATVVLEGIRPLIVEVQALVTKSFIPVPRRTAQGYDNNRLQMLIAVLQKRLNLPLYEQDVFVNIVGGMKIEEPAADLAICLAIISSFRNVELSPNTIAYGEVGLQGEVRKVTKEDRRKEESAKLGFTKTISSNNCQNLHEINKFFSSGSKKNIDNSML